MQLSVSNAPSGKDGPYYDWGIDKVEYSSDGQTWVIANRNDYSTGFPDENDVSMRLLSRFYREGQWRVSVNVNVTYFGEGEEDTVRLSGGATLSIIYTTMPVLPPGGSPPPPPPPGGGPPPPGGGINPKVKLNISWRQIIGNVTETTQKVYVGTRITLDANISDASGGDGGTEIKWIVPKSPMTGFYVFGKTYFEPQDKQSGSYPKTRSEKQDLVDVSSATVNFVFVDGTLAGAPKNVRVSCVYHGVTYHEWVTFRVYRPKLHIRAEASRTTVDTTGDQKHTNPPYFTLGRGGSNPEPGIKFTSVVDALPDIDDGFTTQWVQIVRSSTETTKYASGASSTTTLLPGLDTQYPYSLLTPTDDNPTIPIGTGNYVSVDEAFTMYLMMRATDGDGDWVPLRKVKWSWAANATLAGGIWKVIASFPFASTPTAPGPPSVLISDADAYEFPIWTTFARPTTSTERN